MSNNSPANFRALVSDIIECGKIEAAVDHGDVVGKTAKRTGVEVNHQLRFVSPAIAAPQLKAASSVISPEVGPSIESDETRRIRTFTPAINVFDEFYDWTILRKNGAVQGENTDDGGEINGAQA